MIEKKTTKIQDRERDNMCVYKMNKWGEQTGERKEREEQKKRKELSLASPNRTYKQREKKKKKNKAKRAHGVDVRRKIPATKKKGHVMTSKRKRRVLWERKREASVHVDLSLPICFSLFDSVQVNRERTTTTTTTTAKNERKNQRVRKRKIYSSWINIYRDSETRFVSVCCLVQCIDGIEPSSLLSIGIGFVCRTEEVIRSLVFF
jgi:hypothetical protein